MRVLRLVTDDEYERRKEATRRDLRRSIRRRHLRNTAVLAVLRAAVVGAVVWAAELDAFWSWWLAGLWAMMTLGSVIRALDEGP